MKIEVSKNAEILIGYDHALIIDSDSEQRIEPNLIRVVVHVNGEEQWVCIGNLVAHAMSSLEGREQ